MYALSLCGTVHKEGNVDARVLESSTEKMSSI